MRALHVPLVLCGLACGLVAGCRGPVELTNRNGVSGVTTLRFLGEGCLPAGVVPTGQQTRRFKFKNSWYTDTICIAEVPGNDNCIWVNSNGCDPTRCDWRLMCKDEPVEKQIGAPLDVPTRRVVTSGRSDLIGPEALFGRIPVAWVDAVDPGIPPSSCTESGWVDLDFDRGIVTLEFTVGCQDEVLPPQLVGDVTISAPDGSDTQDWYSFGLSHDWMIAEGSVILMSGTPSEVIWNCAMLGRTSVSTPADSPVDIAFQIEIVDTLGALTNVGVYMIVVDGEKYDSGIIAR